MFFVEIHFILALALSFFAVTSEDANSKELTPTELYQGIMEKRLRVKSEYAIRMLANQPKDLINKGIISKQKLVYPKFDEDLMYVKMIEDSKYRYSFFFMWNTGQCMVFKDSLEKLEKSKKCFYSIQSCLKSKGVSGMYDDIKVTSACAKKYPECNTGEKPSSGTQIDKKYCEKLYGREL